MFKNKAITLYTTLLLSLYFTLIFCKRIEPSPKAERTGRKLHVLKGASHTAEKKDLSGIHSESDPTQRHLQLSENKMPAGQLPVGDDRR